MTVIVIRIVAAIAAATLVAGIAHAQKYPSRPVRILIPMAAGGPGDILARGAAQVLSKTFDEGFVIENRVGADGMIAGEACARAAPDGLTLCLADSWGISLNPVIRLKMAYDPGRDLTPVVHFGHLATAILVHPSVPANSLTELFDLAKAKPDTINWGATGSNSSSAYFYVGWLKNTRGISFTIVPFKAASFSLAALLAGDVQVAVFAVGPAAQQVKAGKARALALTTGQRVPQMPDVPTSKEAGLPIDIGTWYGLFAPTGTPRDIVQRLNAAIAKQLINDPAMREKFLTSQGVTVDHPAGASPEAFAATLAPERERFAAIAKAAGIKPE